LTEEEATGGNTEFQYIVNIRAFETFRNLLRQEQIQIPEGSNHVTFTVPKRLDMKGYKERGLIWSYTVIRLRRTQDVVEEG